MAWIVYQASDRLVISGHPTQAIANEMAASLGAGYIAQRVNDAAGDEANLPLGFVPNNTWITSDGQIEYDPIVTTAQKLTAWKRDISQRARYFDLGLKRHWVDEKTVWTTAGVIVAVAGNTPNERWVNTMDWGRGWVGWMWKRVTDAETGTPTALEMSAFETDMGFLAAELPSSAHIEFWYHVHDAGSWAAYRHQVWRTAATGFGAGRVDSGNHTDAVWYSDFVSQYELALTHYFTL